MAHPYTARKVWREAYIDGLIRDGKITTADVWAPSRWPKELREDYKKAMDKEFGPPLPQWEPPEGSTYGTDPYLCSNCADRDQKEVPADIGIAELNYHHAGTDVVMVKTESGWEMTKPIQEYTIAEIKHEAQDSRVEKTGYCKDCWIHEYGDDGVVLGKKLFGAESSGYKKGIFKYPPSKKESSSAVIVIDTSGSAGQEIGITDKSTRNRLTILDRHVMTASTYLSFFQEKGNYRIISSQPPLSHMAKGISRTGHRQIAHGGGTGIYIQDFDNTEDAIEYLFTLDARGGGLPFGHHNQHELEDAINRGRSSSSMNDGRGYGNVLIVMDEDLSPRTFGRKPKRVIVNGQLLGISDDVRIEY